MPNQPKTPKHGVRVPHLWDAAHDNGTTITTEINNFLRRYVRKHTKA